MTVHREMFDDSSETERPTVMVSGGFDPVHVGHIRMIRAAAEYGDVIVVANSDEWLYRKKGFNFMDFDKRSEILNSIKGVILVDSVNDDDDTVCDELGVELLWGVGGDYKADASSDLVNRFRKNKASDDVAPKRTSKKQSNR